jgi:hypothetical protein
LSRELKLCAQLQLAQRPRRQCRVGVTGHTGSPTLRSKMDE